MTFFDLIVLGLFFLLVFNLVQGLFGRRGDPGLNAGRDSLKQTQERTHEFAQESGMDAAQRENFHDSMTMSVCFARFALQVAYADGQLSQAELLSIFHFFQGAHPRFRQQVQEVLQQDVNNPHTIDWDYNVQEARRILAKPGWGEFSSVVFDGLIRISLADGRLHQAELETIYGIMSQLGWTRQRMESWFRTRAGFDASGQGGQGERRGAGSPTPPSGEQKLREAYDLLGLAPGAGPDEVKARYRALARENHPDRYAHLGEEMQKAATERFQVIQQAYELIQSRF